MRPSNGVFMARVDPDGLCQPRLWKRTAGVSTSSAPALEKSRLRSVVRLFGHMVALRAAD